VNVAPLTLGVATLGGMTPLMARTTPVPVNRSEILTTATDMRMTVTVHIFQTERPMAADNVLLGHHGLAYANFDGYRAVFIGFHLPAAVDPAQTRST
jgi:molecular chaperone DnaK (HSP70)